MLGTIFLVNYWLFSPYLKLYFNILIWIGVIYYLRNNLDASGSFNLLLNSETDNETIFFKNMNIQSAENCKGFSETIRQLSNFSCYIVNRYQPLLTLTHDPAGSNSAKPVALPQQEQQKDIENNFFNWLAGIIDGDGNFDIRKSTLSNSCACKACQVKGSACSSCKQGHNENKFTLKAIRIKLHNRDIRILTRIQDYLHIGRIRTDKKKPYSIFIVSTKEEMSYLINKLNGLIRIKANSFKKACDLYNIKYIEPNYNISEFDPYFSGLIDTDGSIVFNFTGNRIECNLEFKYNEYSSKLNLDNVIPNYKPYKLLRDKKNQSFNKNNIKYKSIAFKFQTVKGMLPLYDYFLKNRLYSDFKFYRVTQIKKFIEIRDYKNYEFDAIEFQIYSDFVLNWIQYKNPLWNKVPFVKKLKIR